MQIQVPYKTKHVNITMKNLQIQVIGYLLAVYAVTTNQVSTVPVVARGLSGLWKVDARVGF